MRLRQGFWSDESGGTAIEYGLIASLIFLAIVTAVGGFASNTGRMFNYIANNVKGS